ncbi:MAG TPA: serine/threonine-protein kinase [Blastocatellia bacterium]|nr:serine/threonine-protein kinase [Blastocatellia bacterium]
MTPERWKRVREILEAALEFAPDKRAGFLDEACSSDSSLRKEVETLISSHEEAGAFLQVAAVNEISKLFKDEVNQSLEGRIVGPYKLIRKIGQGGMGAVYLASRADDEYKKRVAIKLVKRGMDSEEVLNRFRHERQILASLDHANIARLLDGGTTEDGLPYFVMEYVEGTPVDKYCDEQRLSINERLNLFRKVCSAIQYAHQNLVVHRDIKPGNILVTSTGEPKLLDFGIAKLLNPELYAQTILTTALTSRLMTPDYASPEQVRGRKITTATDIYSLGVVLYELLTGHRPYRIESYTQEEIERIICRETIEKPSTAINRIVTAHTGAQQTAITPELVSETREGQPDKLRKRLAGDLDNIVLMAMRKEPERRYVSAEQFSEDIRRHLEGLPVIARQDTFAYRASKFIGRNKIAVAVAVAFLILAVTATVLVINQSIRASRERDKAQRVSQFLVELFNVSDPGEARGNTVTAREILDKGAERIDRELADQPEVQATLMTTIGQVYVKLGLYDAALPLYEKAIATRRKLLGEQSIEYAETLNYLAVLYNSKSDYAKAEQLSREVLAIRRKILGNEHIEVARCLNNIAHTLSEKGDAQAAEPIFREAIAIHRKVGGNEHNELAITLNNLALMLDNMGRYDEAESLYKESLGMRRKVLGDDHPDVASSLNNLAAVYRRKGDLNSAEAMYIEALALARKSLGEKHPTVATMINNLAIVLDSKGNTQEAERLYRESLELRRKNFGEDNPDVATSLNNLGLLLFNRGDYVEAEKLYHQALAVHRKLLGNEHRAIAVDLNNIGILLLAKKDYAGAVDVLRESLAVYRKAFGEETVDVARSLGNLSLALYEKGEYEEAEQMVQQSLEKRRRLLPPENPDIALSLLSLGRMLSEHGKAQSAEPLIREGIEIRRKALPAGHWQLDEAESVLGGCLAALKRFEEAEPMLLESYAALKSKRPATDRRVEQARKRLLVFYTASNKPAKAAQYR